jgi:aminoglycoside phosphotransferase (APT) family kinase protein
MQRAAGAPLLAGVSGGRAVLELPSLARSIPTVLGNEMAALHRLDAQPIRLKLDDSETSPDAVLASYVAAADALGRDDLARATKWLQSALPSGETVICHGDFHPFNVLRSPEGVITVLDWTAARLAVREYDVAFTSMMLSEPPLVVPARVRPAIRAAGRFLARRFQRTYERASGQRSDPEALAWGTGFVCLRALMEVAHWVAADEFDAHVGHPWITSNDVFAERLGKLVDINIRPR